MKLTQLSPYTRRAITLTVGRVDGSADSQIPTIRGRTRNLLIAYDKNPNQVKS